MNYPTFDFDRDKCQEYATGLKEVGEQLKYFKYLLIEYEGKVRVIPGFNNDFMLQEYDSFWNWCKSRVEYYQKHFDLESSNSPEAKTAKISWQGTETSLIYLVTSLIEHGFLPQHLRDEPFAFITKHFVNKDGKPFKSKQLSSSKYQYEVTEKRKPKKAEIIDQIVEETKKKNPKH